MLEFENSKYNAVYDLADGVAAPPHAKPQRYLSMCQAGCDVHGNPVLRRYPVCGGSEQTSHFVYPDYKFKSSLISTGNFHTFQFPFLLFSNSLKNQERSSLQTAKLSLTGQTRVLGF